MSGHPIGAPGSVARFLYDRSRDPKAEPFTGPWAVFVYTPAPEVLATFGDATAAWDYLRLRARPVSEGWITPDGPAVVVDVRAYGCAVRVPLQPHDEFRSRGQR